MSVLDCKPVPKLTPKDLLRFLSRVPKELPPEACWPWLGGCQKYGRFYLDRGTHMAHRVAFSIASNDAIGGSLILHTCDNPPCVNWRHLFKGTPKDNSKDMRDKGRWRGGENKHCKGINNPKAILTEDAVREIRLRWPDGHTTDYRRRLAAEFGISLCTVYSVANRRSWCHIK